MLDLPGVTLLAADTAQPALALRALVRSQAGIRFGRTVLLTDVPAASLAAPPSVDVVPIPPLRSRDDYSRLMLKGLREHVPTTHVLVVQWDGYVVNPDAFDDDNINRLKSGSVLRIPDRDEVSRLSPQQAATYAGWSMEQFSETVLASVPRPERVLVSNVGGTAAGGIVRDAIERRWGVTAEFIVSTAAACGVLAAWEAIGAASAAAARAATIVAPLRGGSKSKARGLACPTRPAPVKIWRVARKLSSVPSSVG